MQSLPRIKLSPTMLHTALPSASPSPIVRVKQEEGEDELDELDVRRLPRDMLDDEPSGKKPRSLSWSLTPRIPAQALDPQNVKTPSAKADAAFTQQLAKQTAPYGPENDPAKPLPGADASYVFPPNRPLRSLLSGISGDKFEDPAFPGRRRESLDLGNSMGNMNPHYRSPSPSLQRAQSHEETSLMGPGNESPYSRWFRRPSLFDVAAHHRRTSRGNLAHVHHPAVPRQGPYDRPYDAHYRPAPLVPSAMFRPAEDANRYKNKRKRADPEQLAALVQVFDRTPFPSTEERHALALRLGMTSRSVQIWFQNRRQTTKAAQMSAAQLATIAANDELGPSISPSHRGLSIQQLEALNEQFLNKTNTPDGQAEMQLAKNLGLDLAFVRSWFNNRRSAARTAENERRGSL